MMTNSSARSGSKSIAYSFVPASNHLPTPASSWPMMPATAIIAQRPFVFSASAYLRVRARGSGALLRAACLARPGACAGREARC